MFWVVFIFLHTWNWTQSLKHWAIDSISLTLPRLASNCWYFCLHLSHSWDYRHTSPLPSSSTILKGNSLISDRCVCSLHGLYHSQEIMKIVNFRQEKWLEKTQWQAFWRCLVLLPTAHSGRLGCPLPLTTAFRVTLGASANAIRQEEAVKVYGLGRKK
jgi:hypothetical protein